MNNAPATSKGSKLLRRLVKMLLIVFGLVILGGISLGLFMNSETGASWAQQVIRSRFPDVASITPAELNVWLQGNDPRRPPPLVIDVRSEEEQQVSTLPNAICISPQATAQSVLKDLDPARPIVVYCAAGYRAATMARRLNQAGCTQVQNLEGGIFGWFNAGLPVMKDGFPVSEVHPYSSVFARMLKQRHP